MTASNHRLSTIADALVFAFPTLILCVPRGAGVFLVGVGVLLLLGWRGLGREWRLHVNVLTPLTASVIAFMVVYVASKFFHHTPWNVIDNPSRALLSVLTCWVIMRAAPNPLRLWQGITVGLSLAVMLVAYQHFVLGEARPAGWVQPIAFANMVAALALVGFARPGDGLRTHAMAWFNVICATLILVVNGTRGGMVAMFLTLFPLLLTRYRGFSVRMFLAACAGIAALIVGLYLLPGSPVAQRADRAILEVHQYRQGNDDSSVGARLRIWGIGMQYFADHPWTGVGVGQFARILRSAPYCEHQKDSGVCGLEHAHSDLVEAASTTGIPGLLTTLGLFLVPAALFWRMLRICRAAGDDRGESLGGAGLAVVMASLLSGLTQVTTAHQVNVVFYAGVIGLLLGLTARHARVARGVTVPSSTQPGQPGVMTRRA